MHGLFEVVTATAVDPGLSLVIIELQPHWRGIGGAGAHELDKPHFVIAKSGERDGFRAVTVGPGVAEVDVAASKSLFSTITCGLCAYLNLLMRPTGPYGIAQVLTAQRAYLDRLELRGMGFVPVLNQVPTDPIVDLVGRGGECRHAGEDRRHHFDVSACRSFKTDVVPAQAPCRGGPYRRAGHSLVALAGAPPRYCRPASTGWRGLPETC